MKRFSTVFLRLAIVVAGAIVLALCLFTFWIAYKDFIYDIELKVLSSVLFIGTILAAIPCFIALCQSYLLLGYIDAGRAFSEASVKALRIITRSAFADFLVCTLGGLPFFYVLAEIEDAPGLILIGMAIAGVAFVIFVFASVLNRLLQEALAIKSENDLTI
jgi:hypothetical protein